MEKKKLVILESPFNGDVKKNIKYAKLCMKDCFKRGEYPFASHLLYTQDEILDDTNPEERKLGIECGLAVSSANLPQAVYTDLGISEGMKLGIETAKKEGRLVEMRNLKQEQLLNPSINQSL